ncbi:hypothetical protein ACLOAV_010843 [Pseudogymnoascus australis]
MAKVDVFCPDAAMDTSYLSNVQDKLDSYSLISSTLDKISEKLHTEQLEIDSDASRYPSVDPKTQRKIISKYSTGNYIRKLQKPAIMIESFRYLSLLALCITALKYEWYMPSAVFLGAFWHQILFTAHDAGHMAITHNFVADTLIGIFIADFCCGLSIGWLKSSHNVHHLVPNHPVHDPDIQNVPLFATSPVFFRSIRSSYYNFDFVWDRAAEVAVQFQNYTYCPIMGIARFNLYLLSWLHLISDRFFAKDNAAWTRPTEILFMACYWYLFGYQLLWRSSRPGHYASPSSSSPTSSPCPCTSKSRSRTSACPPLDRSSPSRYVDTLEYILQRLTYRH